MTDQQIIETLATKVMGWERRRDFNIVNGSFYKYDEDMDLVDWNPLQNIADAWMIVEKIKDTDIGDDFDFIMDHFCLTQITPEQISRTVYSLTQR